jgi:hypothetical protein
VQLDRRAFRVTLEQQVRQDLLEQRGQQVLQDLLDQLVLQDLLVLLAAYLQSSQAQTLQSAQQADWVMSPSTQLAVAVEPLATQIKQFFQFRYLVKEQ